MSASGHASRKVLFCLQNQLVEFRQKNMRMREPQRKAYSRCFGLPLVDGVVEAADELIRF